MAGDAKSAPITVVDVPPVVAPAPSPWALEIAGVHTWTMADADDRMHNINTWGVDVTGVYDLTPNWAATVRVGWATGSDDYVNPTEEIEVENWTITAGLRYSAPITESLSWYAGGEIGLAYTTYEDTVDWGPNEVFTEDFEGWGFAYGIEAGLRYNITPCMYVYGAVHYSGHFAEAELAPGYETSAQAGYGVRMGIGGKF